MNRIGEKEFDANVKESTERLAEFDEIDRRNGGTAESEKDPGIVLRTAICALEAGLRSGNETCLWDTLIYLRCIDDRVNGKVSRGLPY